MEEVLHVSKVCQEVADLCRQQKVQLNWTLLLRVLEQDSKGPSQVFHLEGVGRMRASPSTLEYVYRGLKIMEHLRSLSGSGAFKHSRLHFIELEGREGQQCFVVHQLSPLFGFEIDHYTLVDNPESLARQQSRAHAMKLDSERLRFVSDMSRRHRGVAAGEFDQAQTYLLAFDGSANRLSESCLEFLDDRIHHATLQLSHPLSSNAARSLLSRQPPPQHKDHYSLWVQF